MPDTRPNLLTIDGVAERLGVPVRHVRRLVAERRIPYIKWGSILHFDPDEIDAWIDEHRQPRDPKGVPLTLATAPTGARRGRADGRREPGADEQLRLTAP